MSRWIFTVDSQHDVGISQKKSYNASGQTDIQTRSSEYFTPLQRGWSEGRSNNKSICISGEGGVVVQRIDRWTCDQ